MLASIKEFAQNNGQIYAECGGMMYLGKAIISENNETFKMVNYFDFEATIVLLFGVLIETKDLHMWKVRFCEYGSSTNDPKFWGFGVQRIHERYYIEDFKSRWAEENATSFKDI